MIYTELEDFLAECRESEKKVEIIAKYTNNAAALVTLLKAVITRLEGDGLKERCKRLAKDELPNEIKIKISEG